MKIAISHPKVLWLSWGLVILSLLAILGTVGLEVAGCNFLINPSAPSPTLAYGLLMIFVLSLSFSVIGALVVTYQSRNRIGWVTNVGGAGMTLGMFTTGYAVCGVTALNNLPGVPFAYWSQNVLLDISLFLVLVTMLNIFPDGEFLSPRWKRYFYIVAFLFLISTISKAFWPGPIPNSLEIEINSIDNPFGLNFTPSDELTAQVESIRFLIVLAGVFGAMLSLVLRWRSSTGNLRQQLKWFAYFLSTAGALFIFTELYGLIIDASIFDGWYYLAELLIFWIGMPIVLGLVIFRYGLYDIDIIINKSLVFGALTLLEAVFFGGSLLLISRLFQELAGSSVIALVLSAAVFGVVFQPARYRLQRFVDQRFYNIQIDYQNADKNRRELQLPTKTPDTFEGFSNLELIGEGGMAKVYKAHMEGQDEPVAIKILPERLLAEGDFSQRFRREAETISKLDHPNIVDVFKYGEEGSLHYMVMEYLNGGDIGAKVKASDRLGLVDALPFIEQIAAALDYAHSQGLVHRDIKPSNIMLHNTDGDKNQAPRAVLMDFGIAKLLDKTAITKTGGLLGTFDYIAPEQIQETGNLDHHADIYSFGVLVFQMLTGRLPFEHSTPAAALIAHISQPPPHPREIEPDIPLATAEAILKALEKAPEDRFDSAGAFAIALRAVK